MCLSGRPLEDLIGELHHFEERKGTVSVLLLAAITAGQQTLPTDLLRLQVLAHLFCRRVEQWASTVCKQKQTKMGIFSEKEIIKSSV